MVSMTIVIVKKMMYVEYVASVSPVTGAFGDVFDHNGDD